MSDAVGLYLNEIGNVALLNAQEEVQLSQAIEAGRKAQARLDVGESSVALRRTARDGARAKERFIRSNLRLVVSIARRYPLPQGMELLDLIQEGNLGLEHAVDKFEWRKGFKFSTYATFWIRQSIGRALDQKASLIRLPGDRSAGLRAALRASSGDVDQLDADNVALHRLSTPTSLDRTVGDDDGNDLLEIISDGRPTPEDAWIDEEGERALAFMLSTLDERSRSAVECRFGFHDGRRHSYREVGEMLGLTAEAARRLVQRSLIQVRRHAEDHPAMAEMAAG
jgi:RNA polymerase primary sigma factor